MFGYLSALLRPSHVVAFGAGVTSILLFGAASLTYADWLGADVRAALVAVAVFGVAVLTLVAAAFGVTREGKAATVPPVHPPAAHPPLVEQAMARHRWQQLEEHTRDLSPLWGPVYTGRRRRG